MFRIRKTIPSLFHLVYISSVSKRVQLYGCVCIVQSWFQWMEFQIFTWAFLFPTAIEWNAYFHPKILSLSLSPLFCNLLNRLSRFKMFLQWVQITSIFRNYEIKTFFSEVIKSKSMVNWSIFRNVRHFKNAVHRRNLQIGCASHSFVNFLRNSNEKKKTPNESNISIIIATFLARQISKLIRNQFPMRRKN